MWYLDTSAAMKLLVSEPESAALANTVSTDNPDLVASYLLETELRRAVMRFAQLTQTDAVRLLESVDLYDVPPSLFREAGLLAGVGLRSPDAIHLAAAVRLGVDHLATYDERMISAARDVGVNVVSPGL